MMMATNLGIRQIVVRKCFDRFIVAANESNNSEQKYEVAYLK